MKKIILVDDDDSLRGFLEKSLVGKGYHVESFDCGEGAADFLQSTQDRIDLMVTDIVMPGMDGFALSKMAKDSHPEIKIMYMSGFSAMEKQASGNSAFVSKPFHLNDMIKKIEDNL